ncbi:uncharacterized protein PFLUO_LOCUS5910 [Penicillium psychrofluorescens]|uniref:uncharacterized protein n=1 Tax=Penicillium psychrofluorescens TaxID=3158075 RepID=UPI003CCDF63B
MLAPVVAILSLWVLSTAGDSNLDPIKNYCKRLYHQSAVKSGKLYIDGGLEIFTPKNDYGTAEGGEILGYNEWLITLDMQYSWDWETSNFSMNALNITADPTTGTKPANLISGALYAGAPDDSKIYLYGGTTSFLNESFPGFEWPDSAQYALWSFDTDDQTWSQYDVSLNVPYKPAGGAYAEAADQGLAFYLNGWLDNGTSNAFENEYNFLKYLDGMVAVNTNTQQARNLSTSSLNNSPRVKGALAYIPGVSSKGILVAMGGVTKPTSDSSLDNEGTYVSFDSVDIFDIASMDGAWYNQPVSGDIPGPRTDFCVVTVSAPDNSSHNIYLYGGQGANNLYDDVYVLSLPSFRWIKMYQGESPRYGHTCHLVGNKQMLTVGGDASEDLMSGCDWEEYGVAILDMSSMVWGHIYHALDGEYQVPTKIYNVIGGDGQGNAHQMKPTGGFSNDQIAQFFNETASTGSGKSTTPSSSTSSKISGGAIAGAVVGSVIAAGLIAALILYLIRRQRKQQKNTNPPSSPPTTTETAEAPPDYKPARLDGAFFRNRGQAVELTSQQVSALTELGISNPAMLHEMDGRPRGPAELPDTRPADVFTTKSGKN